MYEDNINKKITKENYLKMKAEKEISINILKEEIQELNNKFLQNKNMEKESSILKKYLKEESLTKDMVDVFLKSIYIYDNNTIRIEWNFKKD